MLTRSFGISERSLQILRDDGFLTSRSISKSLSIANERSQNCDAFYRQFIEIPECQHKSRRVDSNNEKVTQTLASRPNQIAVLTFVQAMIQGIGLVFDNAVANGFARFSQTTQIMSLAAAGGFASYYIVLTTSEALNTYHNYIDHPLKTNETMTRIAGNILQNTGQELKNELMRIELNETLEAFHRKMGKGKIDEPTEKILKLSQKIMARVEEQDEQLSGLEKTIKDLTDRIEKLEDSPKNEPPPLDERIYNYFRSSKHAFKGVTDIKLALTAFANPKNSNSRLSEVFQNNRFMLTSLVNFALKHYNSTLVTKRHENGSVAYITLTCENPNFSVDLTPEQINPQKLPMSDDAHMFNLDPILYDPDSGTDFPDFFTPAQVYYDSNEEKIHYILPVDNPDTVTSTKINKSDSEIYTSFKVKCILAFADTPYLSFSPNQNTTRARETPNSDWYRGVRQQYFLFDNVKVESLDDSLEKYPISYARFVFGFNSRGECERYFVGYENLKWHFHTKPDTYPTFTFGEILETGVLLNLINIDRSIMRDYSQCVCSCKRENWISFYTIQPPYQNTYLSDCLCFNSASIANMLFLQRYTGSFARFPDFRKFVFSSDIDQQPTIESTTLQAITQNPNFKSSSKIRPLRKRLAPLNSLSYQQYRPTSSLNFRNHNQIFELSKRYGELVFLSRQLTSIQEHQIYQTVKNCEICPIEKIISLHYIKLLHAFHLTSKKVQKLINTGK